MGIFKKFFSKKSLFIVLRDIDERGRDLENVLFQYTNLVKPAFEEFCLPVSLIFNYSKLTEFIINVGQIFLMLNENFRKTLDKSFFFSMHFFSITHVIAVCAAEGHLGTTGTLGRGS